MTRPFDLAKFSKSISKSIPNVAVGYHDPKTWISTNNYCLNYLISGDFSRGVPLGKVTMFAGESGSGKSFICSGNIVRNAQTQGILVVLIDTENALDESWLKSAGVDTSPDKILRISTGQLDDVAKTISEFMKAYKAGDVGDTKVLFVIDSLGMLDTITSSNQFADGDMKGDMGRKAKALKQLVVNCVNLIAPHEVGIICTNHCYESQNMFSPGMKASGGNGIIFGASIVVMMTKKILKDKDIGGSGSSPLGIKSRCKVDKTRYTKPFGVTEIFIPYEGGIDPYSGMFEFFLAHGALSKNGSRYQYVSRSTGEEFNLYRKDMDAKFFDMVMAEFDSSMFLPSEHGDDDGDTAEGLDV